MPKKKNRDNALRPLVPGQPDQYPNGPNEPPSWALRHRPTQAELLLFAEWPASGEYNTGETDDPSARKAHRRQRVLLFTTVTGVVGLLFTAVVAMLPEDFDRHARIDYSSPAEDSVLPTFYGFPSEAVTPSASASSSPPGKAGTSPTPTPSAAPSGPQQHGHGSDSKPLPQPTSAAPTKARTSPSWRLSVQSVNYPDRYWNVSNGYGRLDPVSGDSSAASKKAASFTLVPGLAHRGCYSFAVSGGRYLRHSSSTLQAAADDGSAQFDNDATFCPHPGYFNGSIRLESYNCPGHFVRHRNFQLRLDPQENTSLYQADTTFWPVKAWA
jgi:hypothetical protein